MKLFKERIYSEIPWLLQKLGVVHVYNNLIELKYGCIVFGEYWPELKLTFTYEDARPQLDFCFAFIAFRIEIPFMRPRYYDINESPEYGFDIHNSMFWFRWRFKTKGYYLPWAWVLGEDLVMGMKGGWVNSNCDYTDSHKVCHSYIYRTNDGAIQEVTATIYKRRIDYRWSWLSALPFPRKIVRTIEVSFSSPIGERVSSNQGWSSCAYQIKKDETMLECLRRMENERGFE